MEREKGKGGWTDRRDVLERIVKNAQNGLISKVKIRVFAGGGEKKKERKKPNKRLLGEIFFIQ